MSTPGQLEVDLVVLAPVFEDWESVTRLLGEFADVRDSLPPRIHFVFVDDGSATSPPVDLGDPVLDNRTSVEILTLSRNLGHQRAIAAGLCYVHERVRCVSVVVMDGDGQDAPGAVPGLLAAGRAHPGHVVFASRRRRSEGPVFGLFYNLYRVTHRLLTGISVRFGNFALVPDARLRTLVVSPELWNHFAATVVVSRTPFTSVPVDRRPRLAGRSRMSFTSLVAHGLGAFSVFESLVGTRILLGLGSGFVLTVLAFVAVLVIRLGTSLAIPGWATYAAGLLGVALLQILGLAFFFAFWFMGSRSRSTVIPVRDYRWFVRDFDSTGG